MSQVRNPFEHHHDHGEACEHDHDHAGGDHGLPAAELDPAQQALSDALRVSFLVLKFVMALLVLAYLFSGVFNVPAQEVAVRVRFGKIWGDTPRAQVIPPGGPHFALPYPIDQVVFVPTAQQQFTLDREFWYDAGPEGAGTSGPLDPEKDGSLLTGDANIVHGRFSVRWQIRRRDGQPDPEAVIDYVNNVGSKAHAEKLVRMAVEQAIVHAFAGAQADAVARKQLDRPIDSAMGLAQATLDRARTGLALVAESTLGPATQPDGTRRGGIAVNETAFPPSAQAAVQAVITAENEKAQTIEKARQDATNTLHQAAGEAAGALLELIDEYDAATLAHQEARRQELDALLDRAFADLAVPRGARRLAIGGAAAGILNEAQSYRTQIEAELRADAETFQKLLPQYRANPELFVSLFWQQAVQEIFKGKFEVFYLPPGQLYLDLNRDPAVTKKWEEEALQKVKPGAGK